MKQGTETIFRSAAVQRLSSPEQLDQLVGITRPFDWVAAAAMALGLAVLIAWGVLGKIPTRVEGEGILLSSGGRLVDAVSGVAGRLASIDVRSATRSSLTKLSPMSGRPRSSNGLRRRRKSCANASAT